MRGEDRDTTFRMLKDDYGVEDIALRLSVDVKAVRTEVRRLRASGDLKRLFSTKSKRPGVTSTRPL